MCFVLEGFGGYSFLRTYELNIVFACKCLSFFNRRRSWTVRECFLLTFKDVYVLQWIMYFRPYLYNVTSMIRDFCFFV